MDVNSNLLKLKLDMVYHDISAEDAKKAFDGLGVAPEVKPLEAITTKEIPKRKRVKGLVPKNK